VLHVFPSAARLLVAAAFVSVTGLAISATPVALDPVSKRWQLIEQADRKGIADELTEIAKLPNPDLGVWQWRARAHAALDQPIEALAAWKHVAELDPADRDAFRAVVFGLSDLGASQRAYDLAQRHWDWFEPEAQRRLAGTQAAALVRHLDLPPPPREAPQQSAQQVLKHLDEVLGKPWTQLNYGDDQETRLAADRLAALSKTFRHQEAIAWGRTLERAGVNLPPYARAALGNSFLTLGMPGHALPHLERAVREDPFSVAAGMALYYAQLGTGRFRQAESHLAAHISRQAYWKGDDFLGEVTANTARVEADVAHGLGLALARDPQAGLEHLRSLAKVAPALADVRLGFAEVELNRGRPRAALTEALQARSLEPDLVSADAAIVRARIATGAWKGLGSKLSDLLAQHPYDTDVDLARRAWRQETAPQLEMEVMHGRSSAVQSPGQDTVWTTRYRSPGLGPDQRLSVELEQIAEWATFPEGDANERRTGATFRQVFENHIVEVEAGAVDGGSLFGGTAWTWQPTDAWQFTAEAAMDSIEATVRARRGGTTADRYAIGGQWSWFEEGEFNWSFAWLSFSDGNDRVEGSADARRRIWHAPGLELFAGAGIFASRGEDQPDAFYFNPSSDLSPELNLSLRQQVRGDLSQEATMFSGAYIQEGFSTLGYGGLRYRLEWDVLQSSQLFAQADWVNQPYDGNRERSREIRFGFNHLF